MANDIELPPGLAELLGSSAMSADDLAERLYDRPPALLEDAVESAFKLSGVERDSRLWKKIDGMLLDLLHIYRQSNDLPHDPIATAQIRGKIELLKEFRRFGDAPAADNDPDAPDLGY